MESETAKNLDDLKVPFSIHFEIAKLILLHSVPILSRINPNSAEFKGTGIYLKKGERYFIATAHHVISRFELHNILIPKMPGSLSSIPYKQMIATNNLVTDIALFELSEKLETYSPLDFGQVGGIENNENYVCLVGFPNSKVKKLRTSMSLSFEPRFFLTKILDNKEKYFSEFDPKVNFVCDFKKKNILHGDGNIQTAPDPYGMSGGGAYEVIYSSDNELISYKLIGIMTKWGVAKKKYIRCTFSTLLELMVSAD
jgi:hypothetical protein